MILDWSINDNYSIDHVGPKRLELINAASPMSAKQQLFSLGFPLAPPGGWTLTADNVLIKEGAPPLPPAAMAIHLGDQIYMYPAGLCAVVQLDGSFFIFLLV